MASLGRNDPCPCGSGRKSKKCHPDGLGPAKLTLVGGGALETGSGEDGPGPLPDSDELEESIAAPEDFDGDGVDVSWRQEFRCEMSPLPAEPPTPEAAAARRFSAAEARLAPAILRWATGRFGKAYRPEDDLGWDPDVAPSLSTIVVPWMIYGCQVDGKSPAAWYLEERGADLGPDDRSWLEAAAASRFTVLEVLDRDPGKGFEARDLLAGTRFRVTEEIGSENLKRWDVLFAQVVDGGGITVMGGHHRAALGPLRGSFVVEEIGGGGHSDCGRGREPGEGAPPCFECLLAVWEEEALQEAMHDRPENQRRRDRGRVVLDEFEYEPSREESVLASIRRIDGAGPVTELRETRFLEIGRPGGEGSLGRVFVGHGLLAVESDGVTRANSLRRKVERAATGLVRFRERMRPDTGRMLAEAGPALAEILPQEEARRLRGGIEAQVRALFDAAHEELDGRSLRDLARDPERRSCAEAMLKELERELGPAADLVGVDFGGLWGEVGLVR